MVKKTKKRRSLLTASSAKRWMECPPSAVLSRDIIEPESPYAAEGTLFHKICELWLPKRISGDMMNWNDHPDIIGNPMYKPEMLIHAAECINEVFAMGRATSKYYTEAKVDLSAYGLDGSGTVDVVILDMEKKNVTIVDYKYGKGIKVSSHDNKQLELYLLGVIDNFAGVIGRDSVKYYTFRACILQPRITDDSDDGFAEYTYKQLMQIADDIRLASAIATIGAGEINAGSHCTFCPLRKNCDKYTNYQKFATKLKKQINPLEFDWND